MTLGIQAGDGAQALDLNQLLAALDGFAVRTSVGNGCEPENAEVGGITCRGGEVLFDGSVVSVPEQTVETPQNTSSNPRKDVAYIDGTGTLQLAVGDPAPAKPAGQQGRDTFQPAPPDLANTDAVVIAEGYVEPNNDFYHFEDLSDRRVPSDFSLFDAAVAGLAVSGTATVQDDVALEFGDGGDFAFAYDAGDDAFRLRDAAAGTTLLETSGQSLVELTQGLDLPDDTAARLGDGDDFTVEYDAAGDQLVITDTAANETVTFDAGDLGVNTLSAATVDGDVVEAGRVNLPDDSPLSLGATDDAQVRYDSSAEEVVVEDTSTGDTLRFGAGTLAVDTVDATTVDATEVLTDAVDLPDSGPVRFGDTDDVSIRFDDTLGAWVVSFGSDVLRVLPDGTLRIDGQLETVGDADIGGDISFNGTFSPSDINANTVTSDAVDADVELSLPVFSDNANAVAEDSQVWFNDGSGPNAAGVYFYDGGVIGPLATGAGSSPGSLSGLTIDTTKDFSGFSLTGLGHDEVDVPQTRDLTVADFEGGVLPDAYVGDMGSFTVQSSVVDTGDFALEGSSSGGLNDVVALSELAAFPQSGDTINYAQYLADSSGVGRLAFGKQDSSDFGPQYRLGVRGDDQVTLTVDNPDGSFDFLIKENVTVPLNEWLNVAVEWGVDGVIQVTITDAGGSEVISASATDTLYDSGGIAFQAFSTDNNQSVVYFDSVTTERRVGEYFEETQNGTVELGNDVQPSGAIEAGPQEAIVSDATVHGILRSDDDLSAGSDVEIVEWDAGVGRRTLKGQADGEAGVYGLRSPLAERVTQNLTWEFESLSDVPHWTTAASAGNYSFAFSGRPRRLEVSHDGSNSSDGFGGAVSSVLTAPSSLGAFRVTFHNVQFTDNTEENDLIIGVSDRGAADDNTAFAGNGIVYLENTYGKIFRLNQNGSTAESGNVTADPNWTNAHDISIEYDPQTGGGRFLVDGDVRASATATVDGVLSPIFQVFDRSLSSAGETLSVEQVTVEEL